jgi:serine/threonine protein phosphatase PrpC
MADNFYGSTDAGKMRDNNEDNFIAQQVLSSKYIIGCVIDGVGGYEGGEIAAAIARSAILNTIKRSSGDVNHVLKTALAEANKKIFEKKQKTGEHMQMACVVTLALADIDNNEFYYAHVGDTRLYLFRDNSLIKVTHDHSFVGFLEESGRLTEEAAMNHPRRNEINKALGFDEGKILEDDYIETGESPFLPGDTLLLCSDGLSDMLNSRSITGILNSPQSLKEKSNALIDAANTAGGKDNITVVLIHNNKSPLQHEVTKPLPLKKAEPNDEVAEERKIYINKVTDTKHNSGTGIRFLVVLIFLLACAVAWFVYNVYYKNTNKIPKAIMVDPLPVTRNDAVKLLSDTIRNGTSKALSLKGLFGYNHNVIMNDSLLIKSDTLIIHGNGCTLTADSAYNGAAFIFFPRCRYVLLDSLNFQNFNPAFIMHNKKVHLRNVRFINCQVSVAYDIQFLNSENISADISDSSLVKTDSAKIFIPVP